MVHDRDPVAHRERLLLVVGHVDEGDADLLLDALELDLEPFAQLEVEGAERLVEEQEVGPVDQRTGQGHALLLAAGELVRLASLVAGEMDELEHLPGAAGDLVLGHVPALEPEGDVLADVEVGEEGVVLEDHVDRALVGRIVGHVDRAQLDAAAGRLLEAADHAQGRGLAAARRAEEGEELAGHDLQRDGVDGDDVVESLRDGDKADLRGRVGDRHLCPGA